MTLGKRLFDLALALVLCVVLAPFIALVALVMLISEGRPLFYVSERMKGPDTPFQLVKFRTMATDAGDRGVTGGDKSRRISRAQRLLRRTRLDEMPQLWNVLKGDMSFVGPRPPLRVYTRDFPELYAAVLACRPGVTGLASLVYHSREEAILSACATPEATDAAYRTHCIPRKARLDLIYARHRSVCYDIVLIGRTIKRLIRR